MFEQLFANTDRDKSVALARAFHEAAKSHANGDVIVAHIISLELLTESLRPEACKFLRQAIIKRLIELWL